jgi:exopolyphosphatase/guanosine-5'-triphosphate,3'-diphosphate pyrophosphatase
MEQNRLALLVLAHRGSVDKMRGLLQGDVDLAQIIALRLAALFHRSRTNARLPGIEAHCEGTAYRLKLDLDWLRDNPLTAAALKEETREWRKLGVDLEIKSLEGIDADVEVTLAE